MALSPGTAVERYIIEGVLGEGAMAVVYRARHRDLGSLHAIKQLTRHDAEVSERLVQEGRLQSTLRHPNVLNVTDLVRIGELPALVMEYVAGPSLKELLDAQTLNLQQIDALVQGMLRGVSAAHAHGLVHRDLKPANVLISVTDSALVPKIADFGLAKALENPNENLQATQTGSSMGTPAYMAPEQIEDSSSVDARADVFALGAILYEVVTGQRCFKAEKLITLWRDICQGSYVPLSERNPTLPERIVRAIEGALIVDPAARIQSVDALLETWFEGVSETVDSGLARAPTVWPVLLREQAKALVTELDPAKESSVGLDETMAAEPELAPISGSMSPTERADAVGDTMAADPASPRGAIPWPWALVALVVVGVGVWTMSQPTDAPLEATQTMQAATVAPEELSPQSPEVPPSLITLERETTAPVHAQLKDAKEAIHQGELGRAERLLMPLKEAHPKDAVVHMLLGLTYFFQDRELLSAKASQKSARLARDMEGDLGALLRLSDRSWRGLDPAETLLGLWRPILERHDDPMVRLTYFVSARFVIGEPAIFDVLAKAREANSDSVALWLLELRLREQRGEREALYTAATEASRLHPASGQLRLERFATMARLGRSQEAERGLKAIVQSDPSVWRTRTALADLYMRAGQEAKRTEQMLLALSDTTPPSEQLRFMQEHGLSLANEGRLADALKLWRFCTEQGQEQQLYNQAAGCGMAAIEALHWLGTPEPQNKWSARVRDMLNQPELDPDLSTLYALILRWTELRRALRAPDADTSLAEGFITRLEAFEEGTLPFSMRDWLIGVTRFEIDLHQENKAGLSAALNQRRETETRRGIAPTCAYLWSASRAAQSTNEKANAAQALDGLIAGECAPDYFTGMIRALATVERAEGMVRAKDNAQAQATLKALFSAWPQADDDLPLVMRARGLQTQP